jgi:hypothetical protein
MGHTREEVIARGEVGVTAGKGTPRSLEIAERGVSSSAEFRNLMSAVMTDTLRGSLAPDVTNAVCNAAGKLLKMVEIEYKVATDPERRNRHVTVAFDEPPVAVVESHSPFAA